MTTGHQQTLDKTVNLLFAYLQSVWIIKGIYQRFSPNYMLYISPPFLNFRDALFHYRMMYNAAHGGDNDLLLEQKTCINEHLNRGIRDFIVNLCSNCYIPVIYRMMRNQNRYIDDNVFRRLRHIYHELKNIVAEIRLSGMNLTHNGGILAWIQKMKVTINDFHILLREDTRLKDLFAQKVEELAKSRNKSETKV